jgi:hypothetical protein
MRRTSSTTLEDGVPFYESPGTRAFTVLCIGPKLAVEMREWFVEIMSKIVDEIVTANKK